MIAKPGQVGASHAHDYTAARTTNANSTPNSLRAGGTTCLTEGDFSAYWKPVVSINSVQTAPTATSRDSLIYYREVPAGARDIPDGLKMIVGNATATSEAGNPYLGDANGIIFKCGPGSGTNLPRPPTTCSSGVMVISVRFPSCWNGMQLDTFDHISHMRYPVSGGCPSTHPAKIVRVETFFRYPVPAGPTFSTGLSSGPYWTIHADFVMAWDRTAFAALVKMCIVDRAPCDVDPDVPGALI
jgi:hypothetical protein